MNEMTEQPPEPSPESSSNEVDEEKIFSPQNELPFPEAEIDLNAVFPEEEKDLNELFQDEEMRHLLKKIQRNKKDLHTMTGRFTDEDWSGGEEPATSETAESSETTEPN